MTRKDRQVLRDYARRKLFIKPSLWDRVLMFFGVAR
jgi:hypothetical protein